MMGYSVFSIFLSVIWVSIFIKAIKILRKQMSFLRCFSIYPLLLMICFIIVRVIFPIEFNVTKVITSKVWLPYIQRLLCSQLFDGKIRISLFDIVMIVSAIIAIKKICNIFFRYYQFRRFLQLNIFLNPLDKNVLKIFLKAKRSLNITKEFKIIVHKEIRVPAIVGILNPIIILPKLKFDDKELFVIFLHELAHFHFRHSFFKLIGIIIGAIFWWNPIMLELNEEIEHTLEMHADSKIFKLINQAEQQAYFSSIVKILDFTELKELPLSCSFIAENDDNSEKFLQRMKMFKEGLYINSSSNNNFKKLFFTVMISIIFILSYSFIIQPFGLPIDSDWGFAMDIPDGSYLVQNGEQYILFNERGEEVAQLGIIDDSLNHLEIKQKVED